MKGKCWILLCFLLQEINSLTLALQYSTSCNEINNNSFRPISHSLILTTKRNRPSVLITIVILIQTKLINFYHELLDASASNGTTTEHTHAIFNLGSDKANYQNLHHRSVLVASVCYSAKFAIRFLPTAAHFHIRITKIFSPNKLRLSSFIFCVSRLILKMKSLTPPAVTKSPSISYGL